MQVSTELVKHQTTPERMSNVLVKYANQCTIHAEKLLFTTNHDENSWNGTEYEKYGDAAMAFAVFTATWRGIPLIYSGQELPNKKRLRFFDKDEIEWSNYIHRLCMISTRNYYSSENGVLYLIAQQN